MLGRYSEVPQQRLPNRGLQPAGQQAGSLAGRRAGAEPPWSRTQVALRREHAALRGRVARRPAGARPLVRRVGRRHVRTRVDADASRPEDERQRRQTPASWVPPGSGVRGLHPCLPSSARPASAEPPSTLARHAGTGHTTATRPMRACATHPESTAEAAEHEDKRAPPADWLAPPRPPRTCSPLVICRPRSAVRNAPRPMGNLCALRASAVNQRASRSAPSAPPR
jgi:hypothetical protein